MTLIGYWPLDEESGDTAVDYSGNYNDGTLKGPGPGGTGVVNGPVGQTAYDFDGSDDYIALDMFFEDGDSLPAFSVSVWFKTSYSGGDYPENWSLIDFDRSEWFNFYVHGSSGELAFSGADGINDYFDIKGNTVVNDGVWHHGVVVYNSRNNTVKFFVDGRKDDEFNYDSMDPISDSKTRYGFIGDGSEATSFDGERNKEYYNGNISELRFYNHALTQQEVRYFYSVSERGLHTSSSRTL